MKYLDETSARLWCESRGVLLPADRRLVMSCSLPGVEVFSLRTPMEGLRIVDFANWLLTLSEDGDSVAGDRALVWLLDWDIWSTERERVGLLLLRSLLGVHEPSVAPAIEFASEDLAAAQSMLAIAALFQWDALFLPGHGKYVARLSHHGSAEIVALAPSLSRTIAEGAQAFRIAGA